MIRFIRRWKMSIIATTLVVGWLVIIPALALWVWHEARQQPDVTLSFPWLVALSILASLQVGRMVNAGARFVKVIALTVTEAWAKNRG